MRDFEQNLWREMRFAEYDRNLPGMGRPHVPQSYYAAPEPVYVPVPAYGDQVVYDAPQLGYAPDPEIVYIPERVYVPAECDHDRELDMLYTEAMRLRDELARVREMASQQMTQPAPTRPYEAGYAPDGDCDTVPLRRVGATTFDVLRATWLANNPH